MIAGPHSSNCSPWPLNSRKQNPWRVTQGPSSSAPASSPASSHPASSIPPPHTHPAPCTLTPLHHQISWMPTLFSTITQNHPSARTVLPLLIFWGTPAYPQDLAGKSPSLRSLLPTHKQDPCLYFLRCYNLYRNESWLSVVCLEDSDFPKSSSDVLTAPVSSYARPHAWYSVTTHSMSGKEEDE